MKKLFITFAVCLMATVSSYAQNRSNLYGSSMGNTTNYYSSNGSNVGHSRTYSEYGGG